MKDVKLALKLRKNLGKLHFEPTLHNGHTLLRYKSGAIKSSRTAEVILSEAKIHKGDILSPTTIKLLENPDFPDIYFLQSLSRPQKLTIRYINDWAVGFKFTSFDGSTPLYVPVIYPKGDCSDEGAFPLTAGFYQNSFYYYTLEEEQITLLDRNSSLFELIKSFKKSKPFTMSEAQDILDSLQMQGLETCNNFPEFEYCELNSYPILEITPTRRNDLHLTLYFDYEGRLYPFRNTGETIILDKNPQRYLYTRRDTIYEQAICSRCLITFGHDIHTKIYGAVKHYNFALNREREDFLTQYGKTLLDYGICLREKGNKKTILGQGSLTFHVNRNNDWLDIEAYVSTDEGRERIHLEEGDLEQGYASAQKGLFFIDKEQIELIQELQDLGMDKTGLMRTSSNNIGLINLIYNSLQNKEDDEVLRLNKLKQSLEDFDPTETYPVDEAFAGNLRDYQQAGVNWLHFLHRSGLNGCLADDMGLGKTVQTLAFLQNLYSQGELKRVLIIAPVSTLPNWENEIHRFTPHFSCLRHAGSNRKETREELESPTVTLVSYQTLRNDILLFKDISYSYVILDEAQYIKNAATQAFKSVRVLQSEHRLSLTGTPVENRTMDLWSQMDFLNPGILGPAEKFHKQFILPIEEHSNEEKRDLLKKLVYPFILRRKKEDVLAELPPRSEIVRYMEMAPDQAQLYRQLLDKYRAKILSKEKFDILQALLHLRQAVLFPSLLGEEHTSVSSRKFDALKLHLRDITSEGHKVLIFSQFVKSLKIIQQWLDEEGRDYSYLDGATKKRQEQIDAFQNDPERKVFLISLKAGGTGINLTAADYVIIFDPWWNPAAEAQAIDRTHRIGQTRPVTAFRFIMKGTIEEKILKLQNRKRELMDDLVTTEESFFKSLTKEDLEELLQMD
ncbi:MAG: DEAD/DEAH box helicase [Spirochaetales bacterium]|nr:DEAD/DEAH box helicase [Spirochaetales bacterium]